ncbi:hypothetical protein AOLI_G00291320 [Acnodon oligacanthus]
MCLIDMEMAKDEKPCSTFQSFPLKNIRESTRAEDCTGALGAESAGKNNPAGPKPKKKNRVSAFFRQVWQRVRLTCMCCCYKKIHPAD